MISSSKGNILSDGLLFTIILFIGAILIILSFNMSSIFNDEILGDDDISTEAKTISTNSFSNINEFWDNIFFILVVLLYIGTILLSYFIDAHPIYYAIVGIIFIVVLFIAMVLSNTYSEFSAQSGLLAGSTYFPKMNFIMDHLLETIIFFGFSVGLALYGRSRAGA